MYESGALSVVLVPHRVRTVLDGMQQLGAFLAVVSIPGKGQVDG